MNSPLGKNLIQKAGKITISWELLKLISVPVLSLLIPLLIEGNQLIIGSFINFLIIYAALKTNKTVCGLTAVTPSIATFLRGFIWGPFTIFLYYFIPVVWIGNITLVYLARYLKNRSIITRIIIPAVIKATILGLWSVVLYDIEIVPKVIISKMSFVQLLTALLGGFIYYIIEDFRKIVKL